MSLLNTTLDTDAISVICASPPAIGPIWFSDAHLSLCFLILARIVWRRQVRVNVSPGAVLLISLVPAVHVVALGAVTGLGRNKDAIDSDILGVI
ncbi:hypothetical protein K438DRAFT_748932 [Mycena galopus ATCC 62051]|nr:hypothetical protein K438DRAFT_748932 [Mycena galopus ATCC 62051]